MSQSKKKVPSNLSPQDKIGWLAGESAEFKNWVQENGYWRRLAQGEDVYIAGDEPDGIYGLAHGILEISFPLDDVTNVSIHRAEPGFWMGESALFSRERRMVSLSAATDCLVFHIPAAAMERLTIEKPESWRAFYRQSHINQKQTVRLLAESIALSPRARFSRLLLRLSENGGDIVGSQESLGALLGLRFTTCKRIAASLVAANAIESGYGIPGWWLRDFALHVDSMYVSGWIPKKEGDGWREIHAPDVVLKSLQRFLLDHLIAPAIPPTAVAHDLRHREVPSLHHH